MVQAMKNGRKTWWAGMPFFGFRISPVLTLILTECYTHDPFADMGVFPWILNLILYWLTAALLFFLTGRLRLALRLQTLLFMFAGLANYYVIAFRDSPILPWDIFSLGTAASVADNFSYALPPRVWLVLAGFAVLLCMQQLFACQIQQRRTRLIGSGVMLAAVCAFGSLLQQENAVTAMQLYDQMLLPNIVQKSNGLAGAFTMELKYLKVERPQDYDAQECQNFLEQYTLSDRNLYQDVEAGGERAEKEAGASPESTAQEMPHIIVIMDEAFSDMSYLAELLTDQEYMPFFNSLLGAQNTVSGSLHVSVLGGNTANTEFEFLTGHTMAYMPTGSIPYQQFIDGSLSSLASELRGKGYQTAAMHPYYATGWHRDQVYPWMGFEKLCFIEDYTEAEYVRKYVSDRSDFQQLIKEYENREPAQPLFLFNVTMQNHGGYGQAFDNFTPDITVKNIESQPLSNYLSLVHLTDTALRELIAYFEKEDERVLLVFFGDHQPNDTVAAPIWEQLGLSAKTLTAEQEALRYEVPFLIWANYDIEEKQDVETSANFLALEVLRQAGIEREGYYAYLEELEQAYPVISTKLVLDRDGRALSYEERKAAKQLSEYQRLQYYRLFDEEVSAR